MEQLAILGLIVGAIYLFTSAPGPGTEAGVISPPGTGRPIPGPGTQPGAAPGSGAAGAAGAAGVVLTPLIQGAMRQIQPGSVPTPPDSLLQAAQANPVDVAQAAAEAGLSVGEFGDLAAAVNLTPEALATASEVGQGLEAAVEFSSAGLSTATESTAGAVGSQFAAVVGWALPIAAAVAIGGMILRAALSRRGSFGESKNRARTSVARLGIAEARRIADAVLDSLLATGRPPAQFTQEMALQTGYVFANWYDNVDSFKDVFQGAPGGLAAAEALRQKALRYYGRVAELQGWWAQVLRFVQQGDQSWGAGAGAQAYIEEIGRRLPPPEWLRQWADFREFASLGYERMLAYLRQQVQYETVGRWAGEGGNA